MHKSGFSPAYMQTLSWDNILRESIKEAHDTRPKRNDLPFGAATLNYGIWDAHVTMGTLNRPADSLRRNAPRLAASRSFAASSPLARSMRSGRSDLHQAARTLTPKVRKHTRLLVAPPPPTQHDCSLGLLCTGGATAATAAAARCQAQPHPPRRDGRRARVSACPPLDLTLASLRSKPRLEPGWRRPGAASVRRRPADRLKCEHGTLWRERRTAWIRVGCPLLLGVVPVERQ